MTDSERRNHLGELPNFTGTPGRGPAPKFMWLYESDGVVPGEGRGWIACGVAAPGLTLAAFGAWPGRPNSIPAS